MSRPVVSIVVNNYNYAAFVGEAVESALAQTWPHCEVIVVDDGSTDASRDVIRGFGVAIKLVFKDNGGQASAFNAGFAASRGDVVVFLDADDVLLPDACARAVAAFDTPEVVKVHWPLREIDDDGRELGTLHKRKLIAGDYRERVVREGPVSLAQSPTSGNAWARWFLERVLPLPEHADKHGADGFLRKVCPVYGVIRRLDEPLGLYRLHAGNYGGGRGTAFEVRRGLARYPAYCRFLASHLQRFGIRFEFSRWIDSRSQYRWLRQYADLNETLESVLPTGAHVVMIDDDRLGSEVVPTCNLAPFNEDAGGYWGPPADDAAAQERLASMRAAGAKFLVVAFPAFWWLSQFPDFAAVLRTRYRCLHDTDVATVFELNKASNGRAARLTAPAASQLRDGRTVEETATRMFGREPDRVVPLGDGRNQCRAFRLHIDGQQVKCFECLDAERARAVRVASDTLASHDIAIPRTLGVDGHVVFAEWVDGSPLEVRRTGLEQMARYQAQIHAAPLPPEVADTTRFLHLEWLLARLRRGAEADLPPDQLDTLVNRILGLVPGNLAPSVVQPDFIAGNIIVAADGRLVCIDNEFLGIGVGAEFDLWNTCESVAAGDADKRLHYLDAYRIGGSSVSVDAHVEFWSLCHFVKVAGQQFRVRDVAMGQVCLEYLSEWVDTFGSPSGT